VQAARQQHAAAGHAAHPDVVFQPLTVFDLTSAIRNAVASASPKRPEWLGSTSVSDLPRLDKEDRLDQYVTTDHAADHDQKPISFIRHFVALSFCQPEF
jgi:hypothetical protein